MVVCMVVCMGVCCHKSLYDKLPDPFSPTRRRYVGSGYARLIIHTSFPEILPKQQTDKVLAVTIFVFSFICTASAREIKQH